MKNLLFLMFAFTISSFVISTSLMAADQVVTNNNDTGAGSLRQAITDVTTGCTITFNLSSGNETITTASQFSISGKDFTIDGDNTAGSGTNITLQANASPWTATHRLFYIQTSGTDLTVKNMTIQNGCCGTGTGHEGGAFYLKNTTSLTLENCTVKNNRGLIGGFIYFSYRTQVCTLDNCTISGNKAHNSYNSAFGGGVGINDGGTFTATNSTFSGNESDANGSAGFLYHRRQAAGTSNITLTNCTISGNKAGTSGNSEGGAMYILATSNNGAAVTVSITNCTIDGNTAGSSGDGIFNKTTFNSHSIVQIDMTLKNCIISNGTSNNYVQSQYAAGEIVVTRTYTLCEDATLPDGGLYGNIDSTDPKLDALADNGGPTWTHALQSDSPAINSGTDTGAPATDQRGVSRYGTTDMGAYEFDPPACTTPVNPTDGATGIDASGNLTWNAASTASGYKLYFGTDGGGTTDPVNIAAGTDQGNVLTYAYTPLAYSTIHYWKIVPYNGAGDATGCSIWDFTTEAPPAPTAQTESTIKANSAILGWTENGSAASWDIELGENGFSPTGTPTQSSVTNPYTYESLTTNTPYDWYIRADCGGGSYSNWTGPSTFTTTVCDVFLNNDFETGDFTNWTTAGTGVHTSSVVSYSGSGSGNWTGYIDINQGSASNSGPSNPSNTLWETVSQSISICAEAKTLHFYMGVSGGNWNDCGQVWIKDAVGTYTRLFKSTRQDPWAARAVNIEAWAGQTVTIYFAGYNGNGYYDHQADIYFDNVTISFATATWKGNAKSNDWHTAGNWNTGVPDSGTDITIPTGKANYPTLSSAGSCNNITIKSDATGDGSLLDAGNLSVSGTVTAERYTKTGRWHAISTPVSGATADVFHFSGSTGYDVYLMEHSEATSTYSYIVPTTTPLNVMQGYFVWGDTVNATPALDSWTYEFTGGLNTGTFGSSNNLTRTSSVGDTLGWNFVGNPYNSAIDWDAGGWTKTNIDATIYVYNSPQWASYSNGGGGNNGGSQYIASGQGFFVRVSNIGTGTLIMNNNVRVHNGVGYLKSEIANIVKIQVSGNDFTDETSILFREDATVNFDTQYDAYKFYSMENNVPQIYSLASPNMAVNVLPETEWVQLGFEASINGGYTISAIEINDIPSVWLEDTFTGEFTNLTFDSYTFYYSIDDNADRFIVHFLPLSTPEKVADLFNIFSYNKHVYVTVPENTRGNIVIYNMMGQEVASAPVNSVLNKITLEKSAYYVVKVLSDESMVTKKVFIK